MHHREARAFLTLLTVATGAVSVPGTSSALDPAAVTDESDKLILESFLKHCDAVPDRVTPENVAKIEAGEDVCWVWSNYVQMPLTAYKLTGDDRHLGTFVRALDGLLTRLRRGPDGFLGFRGLPLKFFRDENNPEAEGDVVITAFAVTQIIADFVEVVRGDADLLKRFGSKADAYLALAEDHLVKKWDPRKRYVDLGKTGAIYRMGPHVGDHRKNLTHPHNKQSKACRALLALYRVTGKDEYFRKAIKLGVRFKHTLRLEGDRYLWHYWDPAGDWDRKIGNAKEWKHWIGAEHRGGYHALTLAMAVALYDHGVVFTESDMQRFLKTQTEVCWNGSLEKPEYRRTDGKPPGEHRFLAAGFARFDERIRQLLYGKAETRERLSRREHGWGGGPVALSYLKGKYAARSGPLPSHADSRERFCKNPENARFLKELEFEVGAGGADPAAK